MMTCTSWSMFYPGTSGQRRAPTGEMHWSRRVAYLFPRSLATAAAIMLEESCPHSDALTEVEQQPEPRATRVQGNQHLSWMLRLSCLEGLWRAPPDQQATRTSLTSGWRSYVSMHSGSGARPYQCITIRIPSTGSLDHYAVLNSFLFAVIG